jgi:hypothetical protein
MSDVKEQAQKVFTMGSGQAVEAFSLWADASQRLLGELTELSAVTAKESVRLLGELQQGGLEALRGAQSTTLRWQSIWQESPRDPVAWYHQAVADGVEQTQKWFRILEGNAQAVTRTAERLQTTAEETGKGIQATLSDAVTKLKDVYAA